MKTIIISFFYFLSGTLFLLFESQGSFLPGFLLKALIIPILMILFIINIRSGLNSLHRLMIAGLFFSWGGDVILELSEKNGNMFIPGLVCFSY